jgi:hypothetical protein
MAWLTVLKGANQGHVLSLDGEKIILGRNADCQIVLNMPSVSREHALIRRLQGKYQIEDLKSRNGTFVNNQQVTTRSALKDGDRIRICDNLYLFSDHLSRPELPPELKRDGWDEPDFSAETENSSSVEVFMPHQSAPVDLLLEGFEELLYEDREAPARPTAEPAGPARAAPLQILKGERRPDWSVEEECDRLWEALQENHVRAQYRPRTYEQLVPELRQRQPVAPGRRILARDFHRLVLLDLKHGLAAGALDLERFFDYAVKHMVEAFGLELAEEALAEDVAQLLKDEPPSLFCFVNVHLVPEHLLTRLRSFTQETHRALLLEARPAWIAEPRALLDRILQGLFEAFPQADRGFLIRVGPDAALQVPTAVRTRRPEDALTAAYKRDLVARCLETRQALLGEEAVAAGRIESLSSMTIRSIMCVPLDSPGEGLRGVIQLDTAELRRRFSAEDLKRLRALAQTAGEALALEPPEVYLAKLELDAQIERLRRIEVARAAAENDIEKVVHLFEQAEQLAEQKEQIRRRWRQQLQENAAPP